MKVANLALDELDNLHGLRNRVSAGPNSDALVLALVLEDAECVAEVFGHLAPGGDLDLVFACLLLRLLSFRLLHLLCLVFQSN